MPNSHWAFFFVLQSRTHAPHFYNIKLIMKEICSKNLII